MKWYSEDLAVMRIAVPRGLAQAAEQPGSFVFVRRAGTEKCFDMPVSVLRSDYENAAIELAVKVAGPKAGELVRTGAGAGVGAGKGTGIRAGDEVRLRGIYRNGLLGAEKLIKGGPKKVLCLVKGIGLAPAAHYIRWAEGRDQVDVMADTEKITGEFAVAALDGCAVNRLEYGPLPMKLPWVVEEKYDVIMICASDYFQENIYVPEAKKVLSNNHTMCCGEGICGACMCTDAAGQERRMCKCAGAPGI